MKKKLTLLLVSVMAMSIAPMYIAMARGPTNVVGAPMNWNAYWNSGLFIGPEIWGVGTETTIVMEDVTIVVDAIPSATYNEETGEYEGTWIHWKGLYKPHKDLDNAWPVWLMYKFWLNGAGPVKITYTYNEGPVVEEWAYEFIFFKAPIVDGVMMPTLQAYK